MIKLVKNIRAIVYQQKVSNFLIRRRNVYFSKTTFIEPEEIFDEPTIDENLLDLDKEDLNNQNSKTKGYYRIFTNEIQYRVSTKPLKDISLYVKEVLNLKLEYFNPQSLISLAWLFRNNIGVLERVLSYLSGPAQAKLIHNLNAKDVSLFLFQNVNNNDSLSMLWAVKKFKPLILQAEGLTFHDKLRFGSILPRMGIFHKPYLDDLIEEIIEKTQKGEIVDLLKNDVELFGFLLCFLNNSVSLFCKKDVIEKVISPSFLSQLNDLVTNKVDRKYLMELQYFLDKILISPTNIVIHQFTTNLITKL